MRTCGYLRGRGRRSGWPLLVGLTTLAQTFGLNATGHDQPLEGAAAHPVPWPLDAADTPGRTDRATGVSWSCRSTTGQLRTCDFSHRSSTNEATVNATAGHVATAAASWPCGRPDSRLANSVAPTPGTSAEPAKPGSGRQDHAPAHNQPIDRQRQQVSVDRALAGAQAEADDVASS